MALLDALTRCLVSESCHTPVAPVGRSLGFFGIPIRDGGLRGFRSGRSLAGPSPATHALKKQLKAGEAVYQADCATSGGQITYNILEYTTN